MQNSLIASALGFGLLLSSCSSNPPQQIQISAKPVKVPELVLPEADVLYFRPIKWTLITEDNFAENLEKIAKKGRPVVFFALTDEGYQELALNLSDLRAYVQQQKIIIAAYERYYKDANSVIEDANTEIKEVNRDVEKLNEPKEKKSLFDKLPFGRDE